MALVGWLPAGAFRIKDLQNTELEFRFDGGGGRLYQEKTVASRAAMAADSLTHRRTNTLYLGGYDVKE
jgi:hypothetical protein